MVEVPCGRKKCSKERTSVGAGVDGEVTDGFSASPCRPDGPEAEGRIDLVLRHLASATLSGSVRSAATGEAVPGAEVFFFGRTGGRGAAVRPRGDGAFSLDVPVDEGFLGVVAPGFRSEVSGPYRLQPGTTARVEVVLHAAAGPDPGPLADPRVRFFDGTPAPAPGPTSTARPEAPTSRPAFGPGTMGGGSWTGGSWGGWRPAASPTSTPRRR